MTTPTPTSTRPLVGLGCMGFSGMYGPADEAESLATIHAALDAGVTLLDTGDFYGQGHNEALIGRALAGRRDRAVVSVKFGALRAPGGAWLGVDGRPAAVKNFAAYSLQRLGLEVIDIYRPARLDPAVPIEDTVGAIAELIQAGYVRQVGLSEVGVETIRRAQRVHPIGDVQLEYSLASRGPEATIFPALRELGIGATLYGVLSRGLLTGRAPRGAGDFRAYVPRFAAEHQATNGATAAALAAVATRLGRTPAQLALGWVLARQPGLTPLLGVRTRAQLADLLAGVERPLSADELLAVEAAVPPGAIAGGRYAQAHLDHLDSER